MKPPRPDSKPAFHRWTDLALLALGLLLALWELRHFATALRARWRTPD